MPTSICLGLRALFARHGLELVDAERVAIHGGSLRVYAAPKGARSSTERVQALLHEEELWGVSTAGP